ncbi:MAG TPA: hypothetical protein VN493_10920 [Thermoanaerobaculia bacterium]|nr:hypothetical protein [Thermoanaerobaculia bacterium]
MPIYYFTFLASPTPKAGELADAGGAYVNCWMLNEDRQPAEQRATQLIEEYGWSVEALEEAGTVTSNDYAEDDEDREFYEQALIEREVLVFNVWPRGDGEDDDDEEDDEEEAEDEEDGGHTA